MADVVVIGKAGVYKTRLAEWVLSVWKKPEENSGKIHLRNETS